MIEKEDEKKFSIPPKLKTIYGDFKDITETASSRIFEAQAKSSLEKHSIRILDPTKDLVTNHFDSAATLFIQELFHLHTRCPGSVLINTLEISETRKQIACAIRDGGLVSLQLEEIQQFTDLNDPKVIEKLLNDVISDVEFLWRDLKLKNIASIMMPENIYYLKEKGAFLLVNWDKILQEKLETPQNLRSTEIDSVATELRSQDVAAEIKALVFALLKTKKVDVEELETLQSIKKSNSSTYTFAVKSAVEEGFRDSEKLKNLAERMLSRDLRNLPNLDEFKITEDKIQVPFEKTKDEASTVRKEVGNQVELEESKIAISSNSGIVNSPSISTPATLLACCLWGSNKISIIDLKTKQNYVTFEGAQFNKNSLVQIFRGSYSGWTHVKEIPNTKLLVSLHHNCKTSARMEIFSISKKRKANKIYSLGEVYEKVGYGDVTYNSRRGILGAIPVTGKIAYHLFNVDAKASNYDDIVKLNRKSKWHSQYTTQADNFVSGFDFNPAGDSIATLDSYGVCLISDVNTDNYGFHLQVGSREDETARCRWSTNTGEPLLFIKYDSNKLNILDVEKKALIFSNPIKLEQWVIIGRSSTLWIDVCQSDANLVASGGEDKIVKIFDKRESKIVKMFEGLNKGVINCVRWNPNGDMIASASRDETAKLLDFNTGKILYSGTTSDQSKAY